MCHRHEAASVRILSPFIRYCDRLFQATLIAVLLCAVNSTVGAAQTPELFLPRHRLLPAELAVIVNDLDPLSVQIGDYYQRVRGIPAGNLLHVRFTPGRSRMPRSEFGPLYATLERDTPAGIELELARMSPEDRAHARPALSRGPPGRHRKCRSRPIRESRSRQSCPPRPGSPPWERFLHPP